MSIRATIERIPGHAETSPVNKRLQLEYHFYDVINFILW